MSQTTDRKLKKWVIPAGVGLFLVLGVAGYFFGRTAHKTETTATGEHAAEADAHGAKTAHGEVHARATTLEGHTPPVDGPKKEDRKPASEPEDEYTDPSEEEEIEVQIAHQNHKKAHEPVAEHVEAPEHKGIAGEIIAFFKGIQEKVEIIRHAEDESRRLKLENAHLRVMLETSRFACLSEEAKKQTEKVGAKLNAETGTKIGRTLASIPYQIPENMMPDALYTLGVSYFKARDSEKAVAILSFLADMNGDETYKTPTNFLMTGISWFRLDNYKYADDYFSRVIDMKPTKENRPFKVQAKVWKALVAQRQNNRSAAQAWLKRTLESHPQTKEARWVNPQEGDLMSAPSETTEHHDRKPAEAKAAEKQAVIHDHAKAEAQHHEDAKHEAHH